jgi:hypothetical protein
MDTLDKRKIKRLTIIIPALIFLILFLIVFLRVDRSVKKLFTQFAVEGIKTINFTIPVENLRPGQTVRYKTYVEYTSGGWNETDTQYFVVEDILPTNTTSTTIPSNFTSTTTLKHEGEGKKSYLIYILISIPVIGIVAFILIKSLVLGNPAKKLDRLIEGIPPDRMEEFQKDIYMAKNLLDQGMNKGAQAHIKSIERRLKKLISKEKTKNI